MLKIKNNKKVKSIMFIVLLVSILLFLSINANAELTTSSNYKITSAVVSSAGTNTTSTNYETDFSLGEFSGNLNSATYKLFMGFWQTAGNAIPSISSVTIDPASPTSSQDLNCTVSGWSDLDNDAENYYFQWFKNDVLNQTIYQSGTSNILDSSYTSESDTWNCTVTPYDGYENGTALSNQVTISSTPPTKPILITPTNGNNSLTDRTPFFSWNATDNDNDNLSFELEINNSVCTDYFYDNLNDSESSTHNYTIPNELCTEFEASTAFYFWRVRAYDGTNYSEWSDIYNFSIQDYVAIEMVNDTVTFTGSLDLHETRNTDDTNNPFILKNIGNVNADLANLSMSASFWSQADLGTKYLQFKADNYSTNSSFNWSQSITEWTNFSSGNLDVINEMNYQDSENYAEVDINITVPGAEPSGSQQKEIKFDFEASSS